jgi:hypothetical protein
MPNPDPQAAREAAEKTHAEVARELIASMKAADERFWATNKLSDKEAALIDSSSCGLSLSNVVEEILSDPTCLLRQPEWEEGDRYTWQTVFGWYVVRKHTKYDHWWWQIGSGELNHSDTADEAKSACWEHYRAAMRSAFQHARGDE